MSHWEPFAGGFAHVFTGDDPPTIRLSKRRANKLENQARKFWSRRVQLGPALLGFFKVQNALKRGREHNAGRI